MVDITIGILVMTAATVFTRAFPFLLYSKRIPPDNLLDTAPLIPGAVMMVLVLTSLPFSWKVTPLEGDFWLPWVSVGLTALLHSLFRQPLVSIAGGTGFYMTLLAILSPGG